MKVFKATLLEKSRVKEKKKVSKMQREIHDAFRCCKSIKMKAYSYVVQKNLIDF